MGPRDRWSPRPLINDALRLTAHCLTRLSRRPQVQFRPREDGARAEVPRRSAWKMTPSKSGEGDLPIPDRAESIETDDSCRVSTTALLNHTNAIAPASPTGATAAAFVSQVPGRGVRPRRWGSSV